MRESAEMNPNETVERPTLFSNKPVDILHHFFLYQLTTCIMNKQSIIPLLIFQVSLM